MFWLRKCTEPSTKRNWAPPVWNDLKDQDSFQHARLLAQDGLMICDPLAQGQGVKSLMGAAVPEWKLCPFSRHKPPLAAWSLHRGIISPIRITFEVPSDTSLIPIDGPPRVPIPDTCVGSTGPPVDGLLSPHELPLLHVPPPPVH